jgi:hypothetical protein
VWERSRNRWFGGLPLAELPLRAIRAVDRHLADVCEAEMPPFAALSWTATLDAANTGQGAGGLGRP